MEELNKVYKVEDIFEDIKGDPDNINMNIPPEIAEAMGWNPGDVLRFDIQEGSIVIEKIENDKE
tara:strand:- start:468 stop:659 length:192 start_codon:yes stop_codon:yes gene_type:complete